MVLYSSGRLLPKTTRLKTSGVNGLSAGFRNLFSNQLMCKLMITGVRVDTGFHDLLCVIQSFSILKEALLAQLITRLAIVPFKNGTAKIVQRKQPVTEMAEAASASGLHGVFDSPDQS